MKKKLLVTLLMILMYMILASCNSCTSGSAQSPQDASVQYVDSPLTFPVDTIKGEKNSDQDTVQKIVIKKEISKIQVDSTWKLRRDSAYKQLEQTQKGLKMQQRTLDSMLVVKKK